jgi:hypothetical protein
MSNESNTTPVEPDVKQALEFFATLYPAGGLVHFRAVPEPKDERTPTNHAYEIGDKFPATLAGFVDYCHVENRAAFFLPGTSEPGKTGKNGVLSLPAVLVDLDKGDTEASLAAATDLVGPPTMIVESGGMSDAGTPKLHAYWVLEEPATGDAINEVCRVREELALKFGGDPAFKQPAQVIRIPGSVHFKGTPKLVTLRSRLEHRYKLAHFTGALGTAVPPKTGKVITLADFTNPGLFRPQIDKVDRALTAPVRAEGKDEITRFEAASSALGHFIRMIREGYYTEEQARKAAHEWNVATLQPPWPTERIDNEFTRLLDLDRRNNSLVAPPTPLSAPAADWSIMQWRADRFSGEPPARVWTVKGVLPAATAGIFAAVGDAGKSMMTLKLALDITTAPPYDGISPTPRFFGGDVVARGAAVIVTAEDDAAEVHRRLHALDPTEARKGKPLYVMPMLSVGVSPSIMMDTASGPMPTEFWDRLRTQLAAIPDLRLVVFDPLSHFVAGNTNDNRLGSAVTGKLTELATETRATAMMVHHFAKGREIDGLNGARDAIRGASALVDNSRWALTLWELERDKAYKILKLLGEPERAKSAGIVYLGGLAKSNAPGAKTVRMLVRQKETGLLQDVTDQLRAAMPRQEELDEAVFSALAAERTEDSDFSFACSRNMLWDQCHHVLEKRGVDIGKDALPHVIERLKTAGRLVKCPNSRSRWVPKLD